MKIPNAILNSISTWTIANLFRARFVSFQIVLFVKNHFLKKLNGTKKKSRKCKNTALKISEKMIKKPVNLIFIIAFIGVITVYYFFSPSSEVFFPACPFKKMTGYDCPFCGSQRAFHELLHFRFLQALQYNFLFILAIHYSFLAFFSNFGFVGGKFPWLKKVLYGKKTIIFIFCMILFFFFARNLFFW